jgi:hypothetical protein
MPNSTKPVTSPPCARQRRQPSAGLKQKGSPGMIQIIGILIVAEQNEIDPTYRLGRYYCGTAGLSEC